MQELFSTIVVIEFTCIPFLVLAMIRPMVIMTNAVKIKMMIPAAVIVAGIVMLFGHLGNWVVALIKNKDHFKSSTGNIKLNTNIHVPSVTFFVG